MNAGLGENMWEKCQTCWLSDALKCYIASKLKCRRHASIYEHFLDITPTISTFNWMEDLAHSFWISQLAFSPFRPDHRIW